MYPGPIFLFGMAWSTWNLVFLVGASVGYLVLSLTYRCAAAPTRSSQQLLPRYILCVYVCALGAQWFAYAVDSNTTIFPPPDYNVWRYYLDPLYGPKTLYGAILILPLAVLFAFFRSGVAWEVALNRSTPALMTILGTARIGCFLQGCCYGLRTSRFGFSFPVGSSVHAEQFLEGLVRIDHASLPVLPTQIASAAVCFGLAFWSWNLVQKRDPDVFVRVITSYSVFRFLIEFLRADPSRNHAGLLSTSQWVAVTIVGYVGLNQARLAWLKR